MALHSFTFEFSPFSILTPPLSKLSKLQTTSLLPISHHFCYRHNGSNPLRARPLSYTAVAAAQPTTTSNAAVSASLPYVKAPQRESAIDFEWIRNNKEAIAAILKSRNSNANLELVLELYDEQLNLQKEVDRLKAKQNSVAKKMKRKLEPSEHEKLKKEGKKLKDGLVTLEKDLLKVTDELQLEAQSMPNITQADVPIGEEDSSTMRKVASLFSEISTSNGELNQPISLGAESSDDDNNEEITKPPRTRRKRSIVWKYFTKVKGEDNNVYAKCIYCEKLLAGGTNCGTNHLRNHLENACPHFKLDTKVGSSERPRIELIFNQIKSRKDLAIAVIKHRYPFDIGEHEYFETFLNGLNQNFKLPCRKTIRDDVIEIYEEKKDDVYKLINGLRCKISVTTDIWIEEHSHVAYICLTAHYIDDTWELQKKNLAFKEFPYPHDGEALFKIMKETVLERGLEKKLLTVVVDNAASNDSVIRKLKDWAPGGDLLQMRCIAHILSLIAQDGLHKVRGQIGKIRETVRYLNNSSVATQKFETAINHCNLEGKRQLVMDMPNRWNSTYDMLETALSLKAAFCRLQQIDKSYHFNPSESEWEVAKHVHDCLRIFYEVSRHFSSHKYPTSNVFFPDVCAIQLRLSEWKNNEFDYIREMCGPMKEKFDKYWDECGLVLAVAVVFDPRFKLHLVEFFYTKLYGPDKAQPYIQKVRDTLTNLFVEYGGNCIPSTDISTEASSSSISTSSVLWDFDEWCGGSVHQKSELDRYLEEHRFPRSETFSILGWWKTNSPRLPTLAKIARDILAIPATTVASEAAFSIGDRMMNEPRACMFPDTVEALIVTDDWI